MGHLRRATARNWAHETDLVCAAPPRETVAVCHTSFVGNPGRHRLRPFDLWLQSVNQKRPCGAVEQCRGWMPPPEALKAAVVARLSKTGTPQPVHIRQISGANSRFGSLVGHMPFLRMPDSGRPKNPAWRCVSTRPLGVLPSGPIHQWPEPVRLPLDGRARSRRHVRGWMGLVRHPCSRKCPCPRCRVG